VFDTEPATRSTKSEKAETADDAAPAAAAATSGIGILRLNSRPWSQVFVDGKLVGNTPQMGLRLRAGKHQIELVNPQLGMSKKFQVTVAADEIVTRAEMLEE
jgi:serine/threonine-protein kinase